MFQTCEVHPGALVVYEGACPLCEALQKVAVLETPEEVVEALRVDGRSE